MNKNINSSNANCNKENHSEKQNSNKNNNNAEKLYHEKTKRIKQRATELYLSNMVLQRV